MAEKCSTQVSICAGFLGRLLLYRERNKGANHRGHGGTRRAWEGCAFLQGYCYFLLFGYLLLRKLKPTMDENEISGKPLTIPGQELPLCSSVPSVVKGFRSSLVREVGRKSEGLRRETRGGFRFPGDLEKSERSRHKHCRSPDEGEHGQSGTRRESWFYSAPRRPNTMAPQVMV